MPALAIEGEEGGGGQFPPIGVIFGRDWRLQKWVAVTRDAGSLSSACWAAHIPMAMALPATVTVSQLCRGAMRESPHPPTPAARTHSTAAAVWCMYVWLMWLMCGRSFGLQDDVRQVLRLARRPGGTGGCYTHPRPAHITHVTTRTPGPGRPGACRQKLPHIKIRHDRSSLQRAAPAAANVHRASGASPL